MIAADYSGTSVRKPDTIWVPPQSDVDWHSFSTCYGAKRMNDTSPDLVFDPRGRVEAARVAPAPRVAALDGMRLGILDNTKWNGNKLLRQAAARLGERHRFATVNYYKKESFSKPADAALVARIAAENDIVLTAIGD